MRELRRAVVDAMATRLEPLLNLQSSMKQAALAEMFGFSRSRPNRLSKRVIEQFGRVNSSPPPAAQDSPRASPLRGRGANAKSDWPQDKRGALTTILSLVIRSTF